MPSLWSQFKEAKRCKGRQTIEIPLECYITIPSDTIVRALLAKLPADGPTEDKIKFLDFCRRLEELYRCRVYSRSKPLRRSFDIFMPAKHKCQTLVPQSVEYEEDLFLERLHRTMKSANYVLLTETEYTDAVTQDYTLDLPLQQDVRKLDCRFLDRFLLRHSREEEFKNVAEVNQHVLVYHRGIGRDTTSGMFFLQKIDLLVGYVLHLIFAIFSFILLILQPWKYPKHFRKLDASDRESDVEDIYSRKDEKKRTVERRSLKSIWQQSKLVFFSPIELVEPTFREMVVVYRTVKDKKAAEKRGQVPPITIKSFSEVPLADFEIVLPEQKPTTRSLDFVKLVVALSAAVAAVYVQITQIMEEDHEDLSVQEVFRSSLPLLTLIGSYVAKMVVQLNAQQARYQQLITKYLYEKSLDSGEGVRSHLVDSTHTQEFKEAILAFFFLWQGYAQNVLELDMVCEDFLQELGEEVDFEVDDALSKLASDGFVHVQIDPDYPEAFTANSILFCLSIDEALDRIKLHWRNFFTDRRAECPYCPFLQGPH
eukprot:m.123134 g.123134  ORF g.123134 m.123134 type:complete len:539 (-) comp23374_c1_seq3:195-1811(-)